MLYGTRLYELSMDWTNISPMMKVLYGNYTFLYGICTFVVVTVTEYEVWYTMSLPPGLPCRVS
jgi:hypothetical protein